MITCCDTHYIFMYMFYTHFSFHSFYRTRMIFSLFDHCSFVYCFFAVALVLSWSFCVPHLQWPNGIVSTSGCSVGTICYAGAECTRKPGFYFGVSIATGSSKNVGCGPRNSVRKVCVRVTGVNCYFALYNTMCNVGYNNLLSTYCFYFHFDWFSGTWTGVRFQCRKCCMV